jgi:orotidine-5'-phosphate decarboxylase
MKDGLPPVFAAIDVRDLSRAAELASQLAATGIGLKFGLEFFVAHGAAGVERARPDGAPLFLDLKLHDIPATVAGAVASAIETLEPDFLTVHVSGGPAMLEASMKAARGSRTRILGVTVLTSLDDADLDAVGQKSPMLEQVVRLARIGLHVGLDGLVCAPTDAAALRATIGRAPILMVPGIRPAWAGKSDDQKRVLAPAEAIALGADYLVIGRPLTQAADPAEAARRVLAELAG